jgi:signal transduction histidine kinase
MLAAGREHPVLDKIDLKPALRLALALERAPMGLIMLQDELSGHLYPALSQGLTAQQCTEFGVHRPGVGPVGLAFSQRERVTVDVLADGAADLKRHAATLGFDVLVAVPLGPDDQTILGVLAIFHKGRRQRRVRPHLPMFAHVVGTTIVAGRRLLDAERERERAEIRSQSKTQFFARMSHELRTPLQSILGYIELLRSGVPEPMPPKDLEFLEKAARSGEMLLAVIDDLITFSRTEVGRVQYHIKRVAVADAIDAAETIVGPIANSRGVELKAAHDVHEYVLADPIKLKQILINLLTNAVKITPTGGAVTLSCEETGKWVTLSITDVGPGISRDDLKKIFEPFVQLGIPMLDSLGGSGLGLPISREFASAMGGDIEVQSDPGHGSTFTLKLRRKTEPRRHVTRTRTTAQKTTATGQSPTV